MKDIIFKTKQEMWRMQPDEILYLKADKNYTELFLTSGSNCVFSRNLSTMQGDLFSQISTHDVFVRVDKSHVINLKRIHKVCSIKQEVQLVKSNGELVKLNIARNSIKELRDHFDPDNEFKLN